MFWQIHRSVIVNVGAIDVIYRTFRGALEVKLKDRSELLPVSAAHAHLFTQTAH
jgi:DNA-binding LytR/AlgR family response regulator